MTWVTQNATIVHPLRGRIPFVPYDYQIEFLRSYHDPMRFVLKARQIGYSQIYALEALYTAIFVPESTTLLVSRSADLATNLLDYCYKCYADLRDAPKLSKENEKELGLANGSRIKSLPANRSTGRGFAASRVYLDEFAFAAYARKIYGAVSPTLSQGGSLTIGSSPDGTDNLFYELYASSSVFRKFVVPWYHCPAYWTPDERARGVPKEESAWYLKERPKYTSQEWASEYECDFVGSGAAVFSADIIERALAGAFGEVAPIEGHIYLTSVDVGRRHDATVINVFDDTAEPTQRVYHERIERAPYPLIQQRIEAIATRYPGQLVIESNGVGDPLIENLNVPATPFLTTSRSKVQAIQALVLMLEQGTLKAEWTAQERKELLLYQWDDKALTQDCVMSLAIGAASLANMLTGQLFF